MANDVAPNTGGDEKKFSELNKDFYEITWRDAEKGRDTYNEYFVDINSVLVFGTQK